MDEAQFEMAQCLADARLEDALQKRVVYLGESATECESCGIDIPEARRKAVPGCQTCVDCQLLMEARR